MGRGILQTYWDEFAKALEQTMEALVECDRHINHILTTIPAEASNPVQAEAPRWLNVESAMEDPVFQQARAIMGTENWFQDNALRNALNYVLRAAHSPASGVGEREALRALYAACIAAGWLLDVKFIKVMDDARAALAAQPQPCGHPASLLLTSAETGEPLYCEACDDKSGRRDAEARETELMAVNRVLLAELADLKKRGERRAEITSEEWEWLKHPQSANDLADFVYEFAARNVATQPLEQKPVAYRISDPNEPEIGHWYEDAPNGTPYLTSEPLYLGPQPEQVAQDRSPADCPNCSSTRFCTKRACNEPDAARASGKGGGE